MVQNLGFIVTFFDVLGHMFDCTIYPQTAEQAPLSSLRIKYKKQRTILYVAFCIQNFSTAESASRYINNLQYQQDETYRAVHYCSQEIVHSIQRCAANHQEHTGD